MVYVNTWIELVIAALNCETEVLHGVALREKVAFKVQFTKLKFILRKSTPEKHDVVPFMC
jgi:hypothetical protein